MIITEIKPLKSGRFGVYADGEFVVSADADTIAMSTVYAGAEITPEELEEFVRISGEHRAHEKALNLLSYRDHSKEELRRKLERTADSEAAQKAVDRMEELGLVNDAEFAQKLADELLNRRLMGADRALYELAHRGIDRDMAQEAVELFDTDPQERIRRFIAKKYPRGAGDEKDRGKIAAALSRNGYKWEHIRAVLREYDE